MGYIRTTTATPAGVEPLWSTDASPTPSANRVTTGGDYFDNDGRTLLITVRDSGTQNQTVTFETVAQFEGLDIADETNTIAGESQRVHGPFPPDLYNIQSGDNAGRVKVTFSSVTDGDLGVFALRFPE